MPETKLARRQESLPARDYDYFDFNPFNMMRRLSEEMDRAFGSSFGLTRGMRSDLFSPAIDVRERDGNLEIQAELPGLNKDDVRVECTDRGVIIEGEKKHETKEEKEGWYRAERSYGHFYRMIPLPEGAEPEKAKAEFKNGVLLIKVPVPESKQKARQIPITG